MADLLLNLLAVSIIGVVAEAAGSTYRGPTFRPFDDTQG